MVEFRLSLPVLVLLLLRAAFALAAALAATRCVPECTCWVCGLLGRTCAACVCSGAERWSGKETGRQRDGTTRRRYNGKTGRHKYGMTMRWDDEEMQQHRDGTTDGWEMGRQQNGTT